MKTKTFFLLCLFLGIATTQLSAQWPSPPDNKNGTGVVIDNRVDLWNHANMFFYWNDAPTDLTSLSGTVYVHLEYFFKNGILQSANYQLNGEVTSTKPPYEVFEMNLNGGNLHGFDKLNWRFIGNQGSHYIITTELVGGTWLYTIDKAKFLQNGEK
jgi:hypothetical protein